MRQRGDGGQRGEWWLGGWERSGGQLEIGEALSPNPQASDNPGTNEEGKHMNRPALCEDRNEKRRLRDG